MLKSSPMSWLFFSDAFADFEDHFSILVAIYNDVVPMEYLAIEDLQSERILDQLLNRAFQRPSPEVRIEAFGEQDFLGAVRQLN